MIFLYNFWFCLWTKAIQIIYESQKEFDSDSKKNVDGSEQEVKVIVHSNSY